MPDPFAHLARQLVPGGELLRAWPLTGGVSARVTALEVRGPDGRVMRVVVRQHGEANRQRDPQVAAHEFALLRALTRAGLPVPAPLRVTVPHDPFPHPALVTAFAEGEGEVPPAQVQGAARQLAAFLARLHRLDPAGLTLLPLPDPPPAPTVLDEELSEGRVRAALEPRWPPPPVTPALLHGDLWPGNALWRAGTLSAVLDWEDAALGDPLADVANTRLELLWAYGEDPMWAFTRAYADAAPLDAARLALWDLWAALRPAGRLSSWGLDATTEARMRTRHARFVDAALARLHP